MAKLDKQLDAFTRDLLALDEDEAQRELDKVETRMVIDGERAVRLRLMLQMKQIWTKEVIIGMPSGKTVVISPPTGKRPKTRDAIVAFFEAEDEPHSFQEVRTHLRSLGIKLPTRQSARRFAVWSIRSTSSSWARDATDMYLKQHGIESLGRQSSGALHGRRGLWGKDATPAWCVLPYPAGGSGCATAGFSSAAGEERATLKPDEEAKVLSKPYPFFLAFPFP
jgi:hypothetical protein